MVDKDELKAVRATPLPDVSTVRAALEDLHAQVRKIDGAQPRVQGLSMRKSYYERLVEAYTSKTWWEKLFLGGLAFSTSYTLGVVIGSAFFVSMLVTGFYLLAVSIMEGHAGVMKEREEAMQAMEASFTKHMDLFISLEGKLEKVFQSLNVLHDERSCSIEALNLKITEVDEQTTRYAEILDKLSQSAEKLIEHQAQVALDEQEFGVLCVELRQRFQEASELCRLLSSYVSAAHAQHELKDEGVSELRDKAQVLAMHEQVDEGFASLDREIEALLDSADTSNNHMVSSLSHEDKDFIAIDKAIAALQEVDNRSKQSYAENKRGDVVSSLYFHLF